MSNKQVEAESPRHILALSGGKDSAALAVYMRDKYPEIELEYVFTDSGCELPETYEYLDRIEAVLNISITVIRPEKDWETYWSQWKTKSTKYGHFTYLPSPKQRWCTEVLKLIPYENWLLTKYPNQIIHSYVGLRADEKRERSGFTSIKGNVVQHHPFIDDGMTFEDIKSLLENSGLGFPAYYKWRKRSGCYFCFYQTKREWVGLYENHPDLFFKAMDYETIIPEEMVRFTWCQDMSLKEILDSSQRIKETPFTEDNSGKSIPKLTESLSHLF